MWQMYEALHPGHNAQAAIQGNQAAIARLVSGYGWLRACCQALLNPALNGDQGTHSIIVHICSFTAGDDFSAAHDPVAICDGFGEVVVLLD